MMRTTLKVGDHCVRCLCDTSWPDGRWMNLIGGDTEYDFGALCILVDGDWCEECQKIECDTCHEMTVCYEIDDAGKIVCDECCDRCYGCGEPLDEFTAEWHSPTAGPMSFHADCAPDQVEYEFMEGATDASPVVVKAD